MTAFDPARPETFEPALRALRAQRRLDLAEPILQAGFTQLADDAGFLTLAAQIATAARNADLAVALWQRVLVLRPQNTQARLAAILAQRGRRAGRAKRLPGIVKDLKAHTAKFPKHMPGHIALLTNLRDMHRGGEALEISAQLCARFPRDERLAEIRAGLLEDAGDIEGALELISALRADVPASAEIESLYVRALSRAGHDLAAENAAMAAIGRWPADRRVWIEHARLALRRADWNCFVDRLDTALQKLPDDAGLLRERNRARMQLVEPDADGSEADDAAVTADAALFDGFESLGGSGMGCEFGMVQARFGSAHVGLLRWARINPPEMIAALKAGFAGVGDPQFTEISPGGSAGQQQYVTRDRRWLMESHSFVQVADVPHDRMYQQTCRRLTFLAAKLREDIAAAEKIFVYRCEHPIEDSVALAMHAAIASLGAATLMVVMRADAAHAPSTLRIAAPGLYVGYVSRFAMDPGAITGSDAEGWRELCRAAREA